MKEYSDLLPRIVTALIGIAVIFAVLILVPQGAWIFTVVMGFFITLEYSLLVLGTNQRKLKATVMGLLSLLSLALFWSDPVSLPWSMVGVVLTLLLFYLIKLRFISGELREEFLELSALCVGFIYIHFCCFFFPQLARQGIEFLILLFLINWMTDSAGYFAGKQFGKRKLFPLISPKKSVEGSVAGVIFSALLGLLYCHFIVSELSVGMVLILSIGVSVVAQLGDLLESFFKRATGKKDSSQLLPGHGGFFDRFDGVLLSAPAMWVILQFARM